MQHSEFGTDQANQITNGMIIMQVHGIIWSVCAHTHLDTYMASVCKALLCWVKGVGHAAVNTHLRRAEGAVCIPP